MNKHLFLFIFTALSLQSMENPFQGRNGDFDKSCFKCKYDYQNCEIALGKCEKFLYSKGSKCAHTAEDATREGYCSGCQQKYHDQKADLLNRAENLVAGLPACFASRISPAQLQFKIINPANSKYLLRHHPDDGKIKQSQLFYEDIAPHTILEFAQLDLGQVKYAFNIKEYCPEKGVPLLPALILILTKEHSCFSWIQSKKEGTVLTLVEHTIPMQFNSEDRYELALTLNGDNIHNSLLIVHQLKNLEK